MNLPVHGKKKWFQAGMYIARILSA